MPTGMGESGATGRVMDRDVKSGWTGRLVEPRPFAKNPVSSGWLLYDPASCGPPLPHSGRPTAAAAAARESSARRS